MSPDMLKKRNSALAALKNKMPARPAAAGVAAGEMLAKQVASQKKQVDTKTANEKKKKAAEWLKKQNY